VGEALSGLRGRSIDHTIIYFYVLDSNDRLVGVIPTRRLLLSKPGERVSEIMHRQIISISETATLELAMEMFAMHRLLALPVVDSENRLQGIIDVKLYAEEAGDLAEAHRQDDLFQLIGLRLEAMRKLSAWRAFAIRMPWLTCNLIGGVSCAIIAWLFDEALAAALVIAMFIPLVLTLAESIAMQSMTLSLPLVHGRTVNWGALGRRLGAEWPVAALLGLCCGGVVAAASLIWSPTGGPAWVLAFSVVTAMLLAATFGVVVPALLHRFKLDPRVAAGPVVLMLTDIAATAVYLGLGAWWLVG